MKIKTYSEFKDPHAPYVILFHGYGADASDLRPLADMIPTKKAFNYSDEVKAAIQEMQDQTKALLIKEKTKYLKMRGPKGLGFRCDLLMGDQP